MTDPSYVDPEDDDEDPFDRENLEMAVECAHESADMSIEKALLATMDLEAHPVFERSNSFAFLTGMYQLVLRNAKLADDFIGFSNMVAERQMALAPTVFAKVEETLPQMLRAIDQLGQRYDDEFLLLYVEYVKSVVHELVTGRTTPPKARGHG